MFRCEMPDSIAKKRLFTLLLLNLFDILSSWKILIVYLDEERFLDFSVPKKKMNSTRYSSSTKNDCDDWCDGYFVTFATFSKIHFWFFIVCSPSFTSCWWENHRNDSSSYLRNIHRPLQSKTSFSYCLYTWRTVFLLRSISEAYFYSKWISANKFQGKWNIYYVISIKRNKIILYYHLT